MKGLLKAIQKTQIATIHSERQFKALFMSIPQGFYISEILYDSNGNPCDYRYLEVNPTFEKIVGISHDELIGKRYKEIVPIDTTQWLDIYFSVARTGIPCTYSFYSPEYREYFETYLYKSDLHQICVLVMDVTERKNKEDELLKSQTLLRDSQRVANIGCWEYDLRSDKITWNEETFKIYGLKNQEIQLTFEILRQYVHPEDLAKVEIVEEEIKRTSIFKDYEFRIVRRDGEIRTLTVAGAVAMDENGIANRTYGIIQDITERKLNENALKVIRERLQSFLDSATDAMIIFDKENSIIEINKNALIYIPQYKSKEEIIGKKLEEVMPSFRNTNTYNACREVYETGIPCVLTDCIELDDNIRNWFSTRLFKVGDDIGMISSNITAQKKAEDSLKKSEDSLALAQKIAKIGSMEVEIESETGTFSKQMFELCGFEEKDQIPNMNEFLNAIHPEDRHLITDGVSPENRYERSWTVSYRTNPDRGPIRFMNSVNRIKFNPDTNTHTLFGTIQDITELKVAEDEIKKLNAQLEAKVRERTYSLEQANSDLEAFAYSISHDLRAPLRHIDGYVKLLSSQVKDRNDSIENYFSRIESSVRRMSLMIDSLLSFSRLGKAELTLKYTDTRQLVNEIIDELRPDMLHRNIVWEISELPCLKCDENLMKLVFENLISNAIKYTSKREIATISMGSRMINEHQTEIYIRDNGIGFEMSHTKKLFGVFQRLHSMEEFDGIGIGLANVKQIVTRHNGTIRAEGKINEGAVFYLVLPVN